MYVSLLQAIIPPTRGPTEAPPASFPLHAASHTARIGLHFNLIAPSIVRHLNACRKLGEATLGWIGARGVAVAATRHCNRVERTWRMIVRRQLAVHFSFQRSSATSVNKLRNSNSIPSRASRGPSSLADSSPGQLEPGNDPSSTQLACFVRPPQFPPPLSVVGGDGGCLRSRLTPHQQQNFEVSSPPSAHRFILLPCFSQRYVPFCWSCLPLHSRHPPNLPIPRSLSSPSPFSSPSFCNAQASKPAKIHLRTDCLLVN
ncbi:hypothetical protein QBC33DRAFT_157779 [Phialemonium atrogriseum]|uniref:Uncharacterized protein n=1 Tax=Phialemonium atrogriseum TaxID=1093897 RepID=A0AAJ0FQT8_9PEZI|nr:uncharacterized protein QBC33DRAFT_157779 [Phialemonium atrogriseum]KAK1771598.1 hypothetical protein QBC33DRAFT_157779 [Phialemonium atrogriseum]